MPDSLVAKWLVRPLAATSIIAVGNSGGLPTSVGSTTTTTTPTPSAVAKLPMKLGMNLNQGNYWSPVRILTNLAHNAGWTVEPAAGGSTDSYFDADRNVIKVLPGDSVYRPVVKPNGVYQGKSVDIVCRWDGKGVIAPLKSVNFKNPKLTGNQFTYTHVGTTSTMMLNLKSVDASDPIRNVDCREAGTQNVGLFNPAYVASVKRYNTARFIAWQNTNNNAPVTWETRTRPGMAQALSPVDGYPIEYMIQLANEAQVNPWFAMPWNADANYIRKFAEMVRDRLDRNLTVYVELSNEVWNNIYPVTKQAYEEGMAEGLSTDDGQAQLRRYAERSGEVLDIWKDVFAGQSQRLVRVVSNQNSNIWRMQQIMEFRDTPSKVDAIASAPYFELNLDKTTVNVNDLAPTFADLKAKIDLRLMQAGKYKALADKYGKRFITYEAGQHITGNNLPAQDLMQNDPRMGQLYRYYMTRWNQDMGDLMMLLLDFYKPGKNGYWGHADYVGQSPTATVKSKELTLMLASVGK